MIIDLSNFKQRIDINEKISYSSEYIKNTDILKLDDVLVTGKIAKDYEDNLVISLEVIGQMYLSDAITLEEVPYDFNIEIEEILENSLKTLDLIEFLWHYIVLEIPIRYTTSDVQKLKESYQNVYNEDDKEEVNNPFKEFFKE